MSKYKRMRKLQQVEDLTGIPIEEFLHREYITNKKSTHQIGREIGVGGITIHRWLKKFGIDCRTVQEGIRTRHGLDAIDDVLTEEEEQIIRGSLMGDGGLYTRNGNTAVFSEGHGLGQETYLRWKEKKIQRLQPRFSYPVSGKTGKTECRIDTSFFPCLERLRREYYTDKKRISRMTLDRLTPLALAVWYMDDAHKVKLGGIRLLTCDFSIEEHHVMIDYFVNRWRVRPKIEWSAQHNNGVRYPYLKFLADEAEKLIGIIRPHIVESMLYKIVNNGRCERTYVSI